MFKRLLSLVIEIVSEIINIKVSTKIFINLIIAQTIYIKIHYILSNPIAPSPVPLR